MLSIDTYIIIYRRVRGERRQLGRAPRNQITRSSAKKPDNSQAPFFIRFLIGKPLFLIYVKISFVIIVVTFVAIENR